MSGFAFSLFSVCQKFEFQKFFEFQVKRNGFLEIDSNLRKC